MKKTMISIRLENDLLKKVRELSEKESRSLSGMIVYAIKKVLGIVK